MASELLGERGSGPAFPPPKSISAEAQQALLGQWPAALSYPDLHDREAWRALIRDYNESLRRLGLSNEACGQSLTREALAGVPVGVIRSTLTEGDKARRVYLDIHGGALIYLGGDCLVPLLPLSASVLDVDVVSVDYRMPPDHPYPAGLEDCLAVYRALVEERGAENIVVGGSSAGGNLALALLLKAKDEGVSMPAGLVLLSPEADLTESGDSFQVLAGIDRMASLMPVNLLYAAGAPLTDPYVSPLFGDFSGGFPPTFIQSGTRDLFLSNAVRLHRALRRAKVQAELHVWEALPHGKFFGAPEDLEIDDEVRGFIERCWSG